MVSMAGFFAAIVRAPMTGIILVFEMTGNLDSLLPLAVVSLTSYTLADLLGTPLFILVDLVDPQNDWQLMKLRIKQQLIHQNLIQSWFRCGNDDQQLIEVGHSRAHQRIPSRQNLIHAAAPILARRRKQHKIPWQRLFPSVAEFSLGAALVDHPILCLNIVESSDSF